MTEQTTISMLNCENSIYTAASTFEEKGGWISDPQFMEQMGSSYLLAHGLGHPVADAHTRIIVPQQGDYHLYVRTRNWISCWSEKPSPGIFRILLDGHPLDATFGDVRGGNGAGSRAEPYS